MDGGWGLTFHRASVSHLLIINLQLNASLLRKRIWAQKVPFSETLKEREITNFRSLRLFFNHCLVLDTRQKFKKSMEARRRYVIVLSYVTLQILHCFMPFVHCSCQRDIPEGESISSSSEWDDMTVDT